jgi:hypothetical protein
MIYEEHFFSLFFSVNTLFWAAAHIINEQKIMYRWFGMFC